MKLFKDITIPKDLAECFQQLDELLLPKELQEFMAGTEDDISDYHHGLGQWMRNSWQLWHNSILSQYFQKMGIWHADDMSGVILLSFHRFLNQKQVDIDGQVKFYKDFWDKNK